MQTFLTHADFATSACVLDRQRLGKQRVEAYQILNTLMGRSNGWKNHPAVKMWRGYEVALYVYAQTVCSEWSSRGYKDKIATRLQDEYPIFGLLTKDSQVKFPVWIGDEKFHSSHRAALLYKNFGYYSKWGWTEKPELNYIWPV